MTLKTNPYKGTRDLFPPDKRVLDYLFSTMKRTAQSFSYEPYDGPLLEDIELYRSKSGEELVNDQIYSFHDKGERFVAIRPEMTPTLARMVAQIHRKTPLPIRWFSIPNLYRYERPQRGRLREHWQFNIDIFGAPENMGEVEVLQIVLALMKNFGADQSTFEILINDRRIVNFVFGKLLKLDQDKSSRLYKMVDKYKKISPDAFEEGLSQIGLDGVSKENLFRYLALDSFDAVFEFLEQMGGLEEKNNLIGFYKIVKNLKIDPYLRYDPTIVRGVDYYTGIVFEVFDKHPDNRRAICGGGAYANLLQIFNGPPLHGVGFGLGDVTLKDFLVSHKLLPDFSQNKVDVYLSAQTSEGLPRVMELGHRIRSRYQDIKVLTELRPINAKKAFSNGKKYKAKFLALIGERELSNNEVQIKNSKDKDSISMKLSNVKDIIHFFHAKNPSNDYLDDSEDANDKEKS
ncbi:MAG: histidine--tRNA ligase [Bacteriovoracales bacterium]|nr:histidine--tRNA ligase [Bacteriovoracales bacterium]